MKYIVEQGDCLFSIAARYGYEWKTIWDHSDNEALRDRNKSPDVLFPGDEVQIPDKELHDEGCETDTEHGFEIKSIPVKTKVQIVVEGEPLRGTAFEALVGTHRHAGGHTDGDGFAEFDVPPEARSIDLRVGEGDEALVITLDLGGLDPADRISGIQGRLHNLGYRPGPVDGVQGPITSGALRAFQLANALEATGDPNDDATQRKLVEIHGS